MLLVSSAKSRYRQIHRLEALLTLSLAPPLLLLRLTSFFGVAVFSGLLPFEFDFRVSWMAVTPENGW